MPLLATIGYFIIFAALICPNNLIAMNRLFCLLIVWSLLTSTLAAQEHSFFTHYSTEDGLSQNTVMSILQDRKGYLWFATWDGINRFDGYSFKTYKARQGSYISLTNNRADYMYEDAFGFLWLLTYDNHVHRFDPDTETFRQVPATGEEGSEWHIRSIRLMPDSTVWLFTESDGALHVRTLPKEGHPLQITSYSPTSKEFPAAHFYEVLQDRKGNHWLLTDTGLGVIRKGEEPAAVARLTLPAEQSDTLPKLLYTALETDSELLFGGDKGTIYRYPKADGIFHSSTLPTEARITDLRLVPATGKLMVTTAGDGFFYASLDTEVFTHYTSANTRALPNKPILSAYIDRASEVWFEQEEQGVVAHFNPMTGVVKQERMQVEFSYVDRNRPAFHIHEDVNGRLWVHPYGGGFSLYDRVQNKLHPFYNDPSEQDWRFSNKLHAAFSDKQGNLWLSTHSKGLEKVTFRNVPFTLQSPVPHDYESLSNEVRALCEDRAGNIWVGLKDGKLRVYDARGKERGYLTATGEIARHGTPITGTAYFIMQDSKGILWIATKGDGLIRAERTDAHNGDDERYRLTRYTHDERNPYSLSNNQVYCVYEDSTGRLWVATYGGGINYMESDQEHNVRFINSNNRLRGYPSDVCQKARFITSDANGYIWVGTTMGAVRFSTTFDAPERIVFRHFSRQPNEVRSLSNNDVHYILATHAGELYLGTFGGGLNKLTDIEPDGQASFRSYTVQDGLSSDVILSMQEDHNHNLWLGTENGVCRFTPATEQVEVYDERSISFPVRFSEAASALTRHGELLFGSTGGIFRFCPDSIRKSSYVPPIILSGVSNDENIFTAQYAALDYTNPQNIQYRYKLDGIDKAWVFADKQRTVTYANLPKGDYTLHVTSTNSDGVWVNNEQSLHFYIPPTFWETPLAYLLYVLLLLLVIGITAYILFTIYRLKHEVYVEQQVSDIKLRFFTNISHELRTPLTLISAPVEQVLKDEHLSDDVRRQLTVVERNTGRMLRLVNQILDFRKIQHKKMKMQVEQADLVPFVQKVMDNFRSMAEEHRMAFRFLCEEKEVWLWIDTDKFEKILFNLLSNAFKYTPAGKSITVFIHREDDGGVAVGVRDEGIGIAESKRKSLFVRFERLVEKDLFNQTGTGIGLSMVKELVDMHGATISVESKLGEGSCFTVHLKQGKAHYTGDVEFILNDGKPASAQGIPAADETSVAVKPQSETPSTEQLDTLLLVEDNDELRTFLRSLFTANYHVIEAIDGEEGGSKALAYQPDIIISDVMMPHKDGIELTRDLHTDPRTSHIPIILLTAKTDIESKLKGLEYGADDYITKPFSGSYLQARVENLLQRRKQLRSLYREAEKPLPTNSKPKLMTTADHKFMNKLIELIDRNLDNGDLLIDDLVVELAVSRSVFFKKLKAFTGLAPVEFIRERRMRRAAELIDTGEHSIAEVAYMVGINDPRYFSKCFKTVFGMTPTEYKERG
jgi:signal transduction histidine kinase/ligand-binding sensor domain-containing protein/DNA-binding response OmpR family regulator